MPSPDTASMSAAALLTAASVLIAPSAYRAEVSQLFVAPSCAIMASAVNALRRSRGQPSFPEAAAPRSGRTPHRHSRLLSAPRVAPRRPTTSLKDGCGRIAPRCFVPTRSKADSRSSYGANRCELRRTPSVLRARARAVRGGSRLPVRVEPVAGALSGSVHVLPQIRVPSTPNRCGLSRPLDSRSPAPTGPLAAQPITLAAQADVSAAPSARTGITQLVVLDQGCSADRRSVTDVLRDVVAITAGRSWLPARRTGLESASETTSGRSVEEGCRPHLSGRIYNVSRTQTTITVLGCGGENGHYR